MQNKRIVLEYRWAKQKAGLNERINIMDDLNEDPQKVAEDIIKQAKSGFVSEATQRIIRMLTAYHQLREELAELKKQKQTDADVICDGAFAWRMEGNLKAGPFCAYCYKKNHIFKELIDCKEKGKWECPECERFHYDDSFKMPTHARRSPMQF